MTASDLKEKRRNQIKDLMLATHQLAREMTPETPEVAKQLRRIADELDVLAEQVRR